MAAKTVQAPPWLARLLLPLIARVVAREMAKKYPGLGAAEIAEKMRAEIPSGLDAADGERLVAAVAARLPAAGAQPARGEPSAASAWVLVAANLLPLWGVLAWGWEVFPLLALFWMENVVIGVLNAARMLCADPADAALWAAKIFMVPFFCIHYGMFTAVHGVFVFSMFGGDGYDAPGLWVLEPAMRAAADFQLALPIAVLLASHLFSFFWNYLYRGEFRRAALSELMAKPYSRVVILHLTILVGGFGAMALGSPLWALLLLIGIKVAVDVQAHLKEHRAARAGSRP